ncbi:MAG: helix-turn-helix domain-containing protein [Mycobacteriales bacterium]
MKVLHHCDNPPCVRPDDLFTGTQLDNVRDMFKKGRAFSQLHPGAMAARVALVRVRPPIGAGHWWAKLTDQKVKVIREMRESGCNYEEIAAVVGVGKSTVGRVVCRDEKGGWRHVS